MHTHTHTVALRRIICRGTKICNATAHQPEGSREGWRSGTYRRRYDFPRVEVLKHSNGDLYMYIIGAWYYCVHDIAAICPGAKAARSVGI